MSATIKTPLTASDAMALAQAAAAGYPSVVKALMAVDVASRERAWADKGGPELLAALKAVEWAGDVCIDSGLCPSCANSPDEGHEYNCALAVAIAKAEGR